MSNRRIASFALVLCLAAMPAQAEGALTLEEAYARALSQNPQMQVYRARISAAEGNRVQQSLSPNPEAVFEVENFAGSSPRDGFGAAEYTLGLEQKIELADKRGKREKVASVEQEQAQQEALIVAQSLLSDTKAAFMRVAIAQERLSLAQKRVALADKTHTVIKKRISAAKSADIQHTKTDIEVEAAKVEQRKAEKELMVARVSLANQMGMDSLMETVRADLQTLSDVPGHDAVMQAAETAPLRILSQLAIQKQEAALELVQAGAVPDPVFGLGVRRFSEDDSGAFLASLSIPIPVYDRNQGAVMQAHAQVRAAEAERESQRLALTKQALDLWQTLKGAQEEVTAYQDRLLPSAQKAFAQAQDGFDRGAFSFLDMLDAQRTLFDIQEKHLEALTDFHDAKARMDMLTGAYAGAANAALQHDTQEGQ